MERFKSADELLNFAISKEEEAAQFYTMLADRMPASAMSAVFIGFAKEEKGHKAKLEKIKSGRIGLPKQEQIQDLNIESYMVEAPLSLDMTYREALILSMKREKAAFRLYSDMASMTDDENLKNILLALAQEEAKHKLRFEVEYDEEFMAEN